MNLSLFHFHLYLLLLYLQAHLVEFAPTVLLNLCSILLSQFVQHFLLTELPIQLHLDLPLSQPVSVFVVDYLRLSCLVELVDQQTFLVFQLLVLSAYPQHTLIYHTRLQPYYQFRTYHMDCFRVVVLQHHIFDLYLVTLLVHLIAVLLYQHHSFLVLCLSQQIIHLVFLVLYFVSLLFLIVVVCPFAQQLFLLFVALDRILQRLSTYQLMQACFSP